MLGHAKCAVITAAALLLSASMALAEQPYFVIKKADGGAPFEVTDAVIAKTGTTSFETTLPGMDDEKHSVSGPLMRDLLQQAGITGGTALVVALDKYEAEVPVSDFQKFPVIAATEVDGKKLTVRDKGPAWIVYPRSEIRQLDEAIYEARSVWQIREITVE